MSRCAEVLGGSQWFGDGVEALGFRSLWRSSDSLFMLGWVVIWFSSSFLLLLLRCLSKIIMFHFP